MPVKGPSSFALSYYDGAVLDITTGGGPSQMYLVTSAPNDGLLGIGQTGLLTAALQTAVNALGAVTGSTLTPVVQVQSPPWDSGGGAVLEFDGTWAMTGYSIALLGSPSSQMWLCASSPADGMLTSGNVTTVATAVQTAAAGLTAVTGCTLVTRPAVTPASVV